MKKVFFLILCLFSFSFGIISVKAANYCNEDSVKQLAKIIYHEVGANSAYNSDENFFMKLTTAAIVVNNANRKKGNTFYDKLYNLTDNNYRGYSNYKDTSFEDVVVRSRQGEMLYVSALVLSGKYTLPTNMTLQALESVVIRYGTVWTMVDNTPGFYDVYFGYEGSTLNSKDIYNNNISDTSADYYRNISKSLMPSDYSQYNSSNVCSLVSKVEVGTSPGNNNNEDTKEEDDTTVVNICENPNFLRIIYLFLKLIDIIKIAVSVGLIIMGLVDFSKAVIASDEKVQKNTVKLFMKRILCAVLVFTIPLIVEVVMNIVGNTTEEVNFTDCFANANEECIDSLKNGIQTSDSCSSKTKK